MEIISIEKRAFESMMARFECFSEKVQALCSRYGEKRMSTWYDNQEVCLMLKISPRTLQTFRDNGTLPYSQIGRKIYYKPQDVRNAVKSVEDLKRAREKRQLKTI
jgi:hypothetical protein